MVRTVTSSPEEPGDSRPVAPAKPEPGECCESGCDSCIYDRYWDGLDRYERALVEWEQRQRIRRRPLDDRAP